MTSSFLVGDIAVGRPGDREQALATIRPDALPPGTRLDDYEIGPLLGESPLGLVYLATDHALGRKVAIREYLPSALSGRGDGSLVALRSAGMADAYRRGLRAFVEEARLLARFDDPSLLRVLRSWEAHFTAYVVMPYYDGPTLAAARERLAMPPAEPWIRSLLESLANALELLHGESCLHRNVTPDRVLMLRDGRPMLLGPSAVRQVLGREVRTTLIQPGFSAIEEYAESSDLPQGPWTDVYALGALARFCILGIAPVAAPVRSVRDPLVGMRDALHPLQVQWPELGYSPGLLGAIDRALAVDPANRPQSMAEFRELLRGPAPAHPARGRDAAPAPGDAATVDPTRPAPAPHLQIATDIETEAFEASLSAMVDEALVDAPPLRTARNAPLPARSDAPPARVDLPITADVAADVTADVAADFFDHASVGSAPFAPSGRPAWQRWLTGAMAVLVVGAFGYVGWTQYQRLQEEDHVASRVSAASLAAPTVAPIAPIAPAALDPIAEARLHPPAAGPAADPAVAGAPAADAAVPPDAETVAAPAASSAAVEPPAPVTTESAASAPPDAIEAAPAAEAKPARTARMARAAAHEARTERQVAEPRAVCAGRSNFGLDYCMKTQCDKPHYAGNAQCREFKLQN